MFWTELMLFLYKFPFVRSLTASYPSLLPRAFSTHTLRMSEEPFRPREKLVEKQKLFQSIHKHTYLKGPYDKITSVAIPVALAATSLYMIGRGIYNLSHGIGKKE
ncbi:cytochrome-c oxidase [Abeliophyllum distichum]|uniref:Cytochrome-c oxidase n=1 Tax=Abeliophyllum distichum TaxID=126358 RepID=A0ABD1TEF6_9LAMI